MTNTTDESQDRPEQVSWNAHERVKGERDQARADLETAKAALVDANLTFEAQAYLTGKVKDPVTAAKMVLPELRAFDNAEDRQARLDASIPVFSPLEATPAVPVDSEPEDRTVPAAPPTPAFMQPSPASEAPAPTQPKLTMQSPEVRALVEARQDAKVKQMIAEGTIEMNPLNRTAQAQKSGR